MSGIRGWWVASAALAVLVLPGLAGPVSAVSYTWKLSCKGDGLSGATWNWLQDGQVIPGAGGNTGCEYTQTVQGSGDRPTNANGFTVTLGISGGPFCTGKNCYSSKTVIKSFDPSGPFSTTLKVSFSGKYTEPCIELCRSYSISGSATFTMNS